MKNIFPVLPLLLASYFGASSVFAGSFMVGGTPLDVITADVSAKDVSFYKVEYAFDSFRKTVFPVVSISGLTENTKKSQLIGVGAGLRTPGVGFYTQVNVGAGLASIAGSGFMSDVRFTLGAFVGWRAKDTNVRIGWEHISGNSSLVDTLVLRRAENFLLLSMQTPFVVRW